MSSAPTVDELTVQLEELRSRHEAALERAHDARVARNDAGASRVLGEADGAELAAAHVAVTEAELEASNLAAAVAKVETRLGEAEEAEREQRRAELAEQAVLPRRRATTPPSVSAPR